MAVQVTPPRRRPRAGGIKSIVDGFTQNDRLGAPESQPVWEDATCGVDLAETRAGCLTDATVVEKVGDDPVPYAAIGPAFARYAAVQCFLGGDQDESFMAQAQRKLEASEDREVEAQLWAWAKAATSTEEAANVKAAVAAADQYADRNYVGLPVLVMSRATAVIAEDVVRDGDTLITANGTPVIATGAAEDGVIAVIGWPEVWASAIKSAQAADHRSSLDFGLAERIYAIGVDCNFRHTVTITPEP